MEITNSLKLKAMKALLSFVEKTGFDDFMYEINEACSGNTTCYELSLLNNQRKSLLDIRVKVVSVSSGTICEVELEGNTITPSVLSEDAILEAINKNIEVYKKNKNSFLDKISKGMAK